MSYIWNKNPKGLLAVVHIAIRIALDKIKIRITTVVHSANMAFCGRGVKIFPNFSYRYPSNIKIGANVLIDRSVSLSSETHTGHICVGKGTTIGAGCSLDFTGGIRIGENVRIAKGCYVLTHTHGYDHHAPAEGKYLEIGDNAFVGARSVIMYSCNRIGNNAVIGVGSIVTKDIPDNAIAVGNPAKVIKIREEE